MASFCSNRPLDDLSCTEPREHRWLRGGASFFRFRTIRGMGPIRLAVRCTVGRTLSYTGHRINGGATIECEGAQGQQGDARGIGAHDAARYTDRSKARREQPFAFVV